MNENSGILLEAGTNELEVLELLISGQLFGVNVLKIKQIISYDPDKIATLHAPDIHPAIKGTFLFHEVPILLTDLNCYLFPDRKPIESSSPQVVVVCEFNNSHQGFLIDAVDRIFRCSWDQIQAPTSIISEGDSMVTGIVTAEGNDVLLIDFEAIIDDISGGSELEDNEDSVRNLSREERAIRQSTKILIADDSHLVREQTEALLSQQGFFNLTICDDGAKAFAAIEANRAAPYEFVVSDIEMPQLDGLTLCRKLKESKSPSKVIILSSMISEQVAVKCKQVGADAYLSKEQIRELPDIIIQHLGLGQ